MSKLQNSVLPTIALVIGVMGGAALMAGINGERFWEAFSAVATASAVLVAIFVWWRDRLERRARDKTQGEVEVFLLLPHFADVNRRLEEAQREFVSPDDLAAFLEQAGDAELADHERGLHRYIEIDLPVTTNLIPLLPSELGSCLLKALSALKSLRAAIVRLNEGPGPTNGDYFELCEGVQASIGLAARQVERAHAACEEHAAGYLDCGGT